MVNKNNRILCKSNIKLNLIIWKKKKLNSILNSTPDRQSKNDFKWYSSLRWKKKNSSRDSYVSK